MLVKRETPLNENGIVKEFGYLAIIGNAEYMASKSLKMVYTETRESVLNSIAFSLCGDKARIVIVSDALFKIDPKSKFKKKGAKVTFFLEVGTLCKHIKTSN